MFDLRVLPKAKAIGRKRKDKVIRLSRSKIQKLNVKSKHLRMILKQPKRCLKMS